MKQVGMVSGISRLDDAAFYFSAWTGLKAVHETLGCKTSILESQEKKDVLENMRYLAYGEYDVIWSVGYNTASAVVEVAAKFPNTTFCTIDVSLQSPPQNVITTEFAEDEGSFLAGWVAAALSRSRAIGFVGGVHSELIDRFERGFTTGAKSFDREIVVETRYTDSFIHYAAGREAADALYGEGCDILFHAAGSAGKGAIRSAKEHDHYIIGVDTDQSFLAPNNVITSMLKRVDRAVTDLTTALVQDEVVEERIRVFGLKEDAVLLAPVTHPEWTTQLQEQLDEVIAGLRSGSITIEG